MSYKLPDNPEPWPNVICPSGWLVLAHGEIDWPTFMRVADGAVVMTMKMAGAVTTYCGMGLSEEDARAMAVRFVEAGCSARAFHGGR